MVMIYFVTYIFPFKLIPLRFTVIYTIYITQLSWLRHYATNRQVAFPIPDEVNF
jgi:hypothetical protein